MKTIWRYVEKRSISEITKAKLFLFLNSMAWLIIAALLGSAIGIIIGWSQSVIEIVLTVAGYSAISIGFVGGFVFLDRHEF